MSLSLRTSGKDLRVLSAELRRQGDREIKRKMSRQLRASAAPMVPAVRASIAAIPVKGTSGSTGLRQRLQKATRLKVRTTGREAQVTILVDPKRMPPGQMALPQAMEGLKRWRHPVFGDRAVWVTQEPHAYFFRVVRPLGIASRVAVAKVIRDITREIT